jgi:biotin operon repressor|tara:strand:+ start:3986 stop:4114 length:129 start_codon:yes stop_codon:yes gene_type:complete
MKHINAFENQIFDAFRKKEKKIKKAIKILEKEGYKIIKKIPV